jgi:transaldolase/glucose-6-phosphate isomerase
MPTDPARMGSFKLGSYEAKVSERLKEWDSKDVGRRIWEKAFTVWSGTELPELTDRLGWLDLPESMKGELGSIRTLADEIKAQEVKYVVLLGMGGSSLAPEVYQTTFGNAPEYPELVVLDSTHPDQVRAVESQIDLKQTLFIVASKSGTTFESLCLFKYFHDCVSKVASTPGYHFVAITDPGTPLQDLARKQRFRRVFSATPDVGGRYSALSHFGLVPAALIGMDLGRFLSRARSMAVTCAPAAPEDDNPGLVLGAALGELTRAGRDKVTFVTSPSLASFPQWLEQLIAESTGKDGKGIIPVAGEELGAPKDYGSDRFFIYMAIANEIDGRIEGRLEALEGAGHPVARFVLRDREDLALEIFRWELAIASAGALLGIHPFNQPDVQLTKDLARKAMAREIEAACADDAVSAGSGEELGKALKSLLDKAKPGAYFGIHAYLASRAETKTGLQAIRMSIRDGLKLATTLGFGPCFLHSTGQLHKGGPNTGLFLQLLDTPAEDIPVPETDYTLGQVIAAQALGDYQALRQRDRRVLRVQLGKDTIKGLEVLAAALGRSL